MRVAVTDDPAAEAVVPCIWLGFVVSGLITWMCGQTHFGLTGCLGGQGQDTTTGGGGGGGVTTTTVGGGGLTGGGTGAGQTRPRRER
jgi:hypothetical protein